MMPMSTMAQQIFYSGRVQGVGFRYTVKQTAAGYEVVGSVRNLPDGRVELQVAGEEGEVEAFLKAIGSGQLAGYIKQAERSPMEVPSEKWTTFEIRR